jgi:tetratricopeptide (TPR) repeat protein
MMDQEKASKLARQGFNSFEEKKYQEAEALYREALSLADPNHWALEDYHGEFSLVLGALGKVTEAREQLVLSLKAAMRASDTETALNVTIARHFLAEHMVDNKEYESAVDFLSPFIGSGCEKEWLLFYPLIRAYLALGKEEIGRRLVNEAVANSPDEERSNVKEKLEKLFNADNS